MLLLLELQHGVERSVDTTLYARHAYQSVFARAARSLDAGARLRLAAVPASVVDLCERWVRDADDADDYVELYGDAAPPWYASLSLARARTCAPHLRTLDMLAMCGDVERILVASEAYVFSGVPVFALRTSMPSCSTSTVSPAAAAAATAAVASTHLVLAYDAATWHIDGVAPRSTTYEAAAASTTTTTMTTTPVTEAATTSLPRRVAHRVARERAFELGARSFDAVGRARLRGQRIAARFAAPASLCNPASLRARYKLYVDARLDADAYNARFVAETNRYGPHVAQLDRHLAAVFLERHGTAADADAVAGRDVGAIDGGDAENAAVGTGDCASDGAASARGARRAVAPRSPAARMLGVLDATLRELGVRRDSPLGLLHALRHAFAAEWAFKFESCINETLRRCVDDATHLDILVDVLLADMLGYFHSRCEWNRLSASHLFVRHLEACAQPHVHFDEPGRAIDALRAILPRDFGANPVAWLERDEVRRRRGRSLRCDDDNDSDERIVASARVASKVHDADDGRDDTDAPSAVGVPGALAGAQVPSEPE